MQYPRFVALRRKIWDELEARLGAAESARGTADRLGHDDLEQLAFQYRQVLHDHALAAARYPETGAAARLQRLVQRATRTLVYDREQHRLGLRSFFTTAFPAAFRAHLPQLALAIGLFVAGALFGLGLAGAQPQLGQLILGPERIEGLADGRLWTEALTTTIPSSVSTSAIATNNMSVALVAWAGGALAGLGTLYIVLLNGLNLGCIVAITMHYRMDGPLLAFIAAHGPLEITLILVAAAAGLGLAGALVKAEDRPRSQVLRERAGRSLVLLLGCLPWFLVLALVESQVSPSPHFSPWLKGLIGLALLTLFLAIALKSFPTNWRRGQGSPGASDLDRRPICRKALDSAGSTGKEERHEQ